MAKDKGPSWFHSCLPRIKIEAGNNQQCFYLLMASPSLHCYVRASSLVESEAIPGVV